MEKRVNAMGLSEQEKKLVQQHLTIINPIIYKFVNETIQGLGYDDLYQTACEALCYAAVKYDSKKETSFRTFATTVIKNKLIDCSRKYHQLQAKLQYLEATIEDSSTLTYYDILSVSSQNNLDKNIFYVLDEIEEKYKGITKKGIHALKLYYSGYSRREIATAYKQKPNYISAWMSRAKQKLKTEHKILELQAN